MANVNNPHGLMPMCRRASGGASELRAYVKAAAYGQAIFRWDPVTQLAGVLNGPASGITAGTTRLRGVSAEYSAASTLKNLLVYDHPEDLFDVQGDGSDATKLVAATEGYNANLSTTAGGTPVGDNSNVAIVESGVAVTATLDVNYRRLIPVVGNAYGLYARVEVRINKHLGNHEVTQT